MKYNALRKVYFYFEGGLGDVILQYFSDRHVGGLSEYRKMHWWSYVKLYLNVTNSSSAELFRYHQEFDEIQTYTYSVKLRRVLQHSAAEDGYVHWGGVNPLNMPVQIKIGGHDEEYLKRVLPVNKFIVYHCGSSKADMQLHLQNPLLFDAAQSHGFSVVCVGGTSLDPKRMIVEPQSNFDDHPACINLLGMANPRLVCEIARRSSGFIGSLSCYALAASVQKKDAVVFVPTGFNDDYCDIVKNKGGKILGFDDIQHTPQFYDSLIKSSTENGLFC